MLRILAKSTGNGNGYTLFLGFKIGKEGLYVHSFIKFLICQQVVKLLTFNCFQFKNNRNLEASI